MKTNCFYTYAHFKPDNTIFYIGKGKGNRAYQIQNRNTYWKKIIEKYGKHRVEILAHWDTENEAYSHEKLLIACFTDLGYKLANLNKGGVGVMSGLHHSNETKLKISKALSGKERTKKHCNNLKFAFLGKTHTKETKELISKTHKGKKQNAEHIAKRIKSRLATMAKKQLQGSV